MRNTTRKSRKSDLSQDDPFSSSCQRNLEKRGNAEVLKVSLLLGLAFSLVGKSVWGEMEDLRSLTHRLVLENGGDGETRR